MGVDSKDKSISRSMLADALAYHCGEHAALGFPFPGRTLLETKHATVDSRAIFVVDDEPSLPGVECRVVKHLAIMGNLDSSLASSILDAILRTSATTHLIVESYNSKALDFVRSLNCPETYFCQCKLLAQMDSLRGRRFNSFPPGIRIRNFSPGADEGTYTELYNKILGFLAAKPVGRTFMEGVMARPSFDPLGYFIVEKDGEPAGFASIEVEPWGGRPSGFGYIFQFGLDKSLHGTGASSCLFGHILSFAKRKGLSRIGVGVRKGNSPAIGFFNKMGFEERFNVCGYLLEK